MIDSVALKLAEAIKRTEPSRTASIEVMKFSLIVLIHTAITFSIIALVGILTHSFMSTMMGLLAFIILRFVSGGLHLKKAINCSIVSVVLITTAPHVPLTKDITIIITIVSLIIILILAPANIENHARIPKKYFPLLKGISAVIVCANFFILSSTVALVFLIQAITLTPYMRR